MKKVLFDVNLFQEKNFWRKILRKIRVMSVFGTRPEAIKMAPLVQELEKNKNIENKNQADFVRLIFMENIILKLLNGFKR